jgi:hypothetical protein
MRGVAVTEEPTGNSRDSLNTITAFTILGAVNGLLLGLGILVVTCSSMSNLPGRDDSRRYCWRASSEFRRPAELAWE